MFAAIALGLAAGASAQLNPRVPDLPQNSLNGAIYQNYTCVLPFFGTQVFQVYFTGFSPSVIAPSQPYQITGGQGYLIANSNVTYGANLLGAKSADVNITTLGLQTYTGSQSSNVYNGLPATIQLKNVTWTVGASLPLKLPTSGTLNTPANTITTAAGGVVAVNLGNSTGVIQLKDGNGKNVQGPLSTNCTAPVVPVLLTTLNVRGAANTTALSVTPGATGFPNITTPIGYQRGSFRFPTNCTFTGLSGTRQISLYLTGTLPTNAVSGQKFTFSNGTGAVRIPASVATEIKNANSGAVSATGSVTAFNVLFSKTSEGGVNVASTPLTFPSTSLAGNSAYGNDVVIVLPTASTSTLAGTVTVSAGNSGTFLNLSPGTATASFTLQNASGGTVGSTISVSCAAPGQNLIVVPIA